MLFGHIIRVSLFFQIFYHFTQSVSSPNTKRNEIRTTEHCNRTYYGQTGTKNPLYLKEPLQKFAPFHCEITFSALGGNYGDIIELTVLSFQVGFFPLTKEQPVCEYGYVRIHEKSANVASQISGQAKQLRQQEPSTLAYGAKNSSDYGKFCGQLMSRRAVFYSQGNNLTVTISLQEGRAFFSQYLPLNIYLTYRFLQTSSFYNASDFIADVGIKLTGTQCSRLFEDCLSSKKCRIQSPNYPGFYPRNRTCHYLIRQTKRIPKGYRARISINQPNEYKISIFSGSSSTNNGKQTRTGLISDCPLDRISVYDGLTTDAPKLLTFCGTGILPVLTSTNNSILIVLNSVAENALSDSRFELNVEITLIKEDTAELSAYRQSACNYIYHGSKIRRGLIEGSGRSIPPNVTCSYRFISDNKNDKVWIQFISYFVEDSRPWSSEEKCDSSEMKIYEEFDNDLNYRRSHQSFSSSSHPVSNHVKLIGRFCEKSSPKICGRVLNGSIPVVPCSYPKESYLSKSSNIVITAVHHRSPGLTSIPATFSALFEFIDSEEYGDPIMGTLCDRRFVSSKYPEGNIKSSHNLFLFGRGGNPDVSCSYYFNGKPGERLRITITAIKLKSTNCVQSVDGFVNSYLCHHHSHHHSPESSSHVHRGKRIYERLSPVSSSSPSSSSTSSSSSSVNSLTSTLRVYDSVTNELLNVACFCDSTNLTLFNRKPIILNLIGPNSVLNFTVTGMSPYHDYNNFYFEAKYEFLSDNHCSPNQIETKSDGEGEINYTVPSNHDFTNNNQFKCRWIFVWYPNKYVSIRINGYRPTRSRGCQTKNRYIIYWGSPWKPMVTLCAGNNLTVGLEGTGSDHVETINLSLSLMRERSSASYYSQAYSSRDSELSSSASVPLPFYETPRLWSQDNLSPSSAISFFNQSSLRVIVEIVAESPGSFNFRWMTLKSSPSSGDPETSETLRNTDCIYKCPELNFCLAPDLICDGVKHCPSGYDESAVFCSSVHLVWTILFGLLFAVFLVLGVSYGVLVVVRKRRGALRSVHDMGDLPATICSLIDSTTLRPTFILPHGNTLSTLGEFEFRSTCDPNNLGTAMQSTRYSSSTGSSSGQQILSTNSSSSPPFSNSTESFNAALASRFDGSSNTYFTSSSSLSYHHHRQNQQQHSSQRPHRFQHSTFTTSSSPNQQSSPRHVYKNVSDDDSFLCIS